MKVLFKNRLLTCFIAMVFVFCSFVLPVSAEDSEEDNVLKPYIDELALLNNELGVDYCVVSEENMSEEEYAEMVTFFTSMNIEDFRTYIISAYQNDIESQNNPDDSLPSQVSPAAYSSIQRYYYSGNSNYLAIQSTAYTGDGYERYYTIDTYGYSMVSFPAYYPHTFSSTISSDKRRVSCVYNCTRYITEYIADTAGHIVNVTFTAGAGDIIGSTQV